MSDGSPLAWDVIDDDTRNLIVKMSTHRLLGSVAALPPMEAADRVSTVIADTLDGAVAAAGIKGDAAPSVRRHFTRLLEKHLRECAASLSPQPS